MVTDSDRVQSIRVLSEKNNEPNEQRGCVGGSNAVSPHARKKQDRTLREGGKGSEKHEREESGWKKSEY